MAAIQGHSSSGGLALHMAFELSQGKWKLGFSIGLGQKVRFKQIEAGNLPALLAEIGKAKRRFRLCEEAPVRSCYEAGRDGFWLHRFLESEGITNVVVDSASIQVDRRRRRAKADGLDAEKLVTMLLRYHNGEDKVWRVVRVPSLADEDQREFHRGLQTLKRKRTESSNRIKGLLIKYGVRDEVDATLLERLREVRLWDGQPLPAGVLERLSWELADWQQAEERIRAVEKVRLERIEKSPAACMDKVRRLMQLRGVGPHAAWLLTMECFGWRQFANRRQAGGLTGLTPTPYQSGDVNYEQGISKAGNRWVRGLLVELAWLWIRYQPGSELTLWFQRRFAAGQRRLRRIGIVALGRKLFIALWRYAEWGEVPEGAMEVEWRAKLKGRCVLKKAS
jgi:transposase